MKRFVFKVILPVFIICGVLFWSGELYLRSIPNDYKTQNNYLVSNAGVLRILVLGSSSTSRGILPRHLDIQPSYNCAYSARSIDYDYYILEKYIDKMDSLKFVILDMNYTKLWFMMGPDNRTATYLKYYSIYWGISEYGGFENKYEMSTSFTDFEGLKYKYKKSNLEYDGYQAGKNQEYDEEKWRAYGPDRIASFMLGDSIKDKYNYDRNVEFLTKMAELCQKKDVKLIVVWVPVDKTMSEYYEDQRLDIINSTMVALQKKFDNFYYLDLYNDTTFTHEYMKDPDHLNREGAKKLTSILNEYILQLN